MSGYFGSSGGDGGFPPNRRLKRSADEMEDEISSEDGVEAEELKDESLFELGTWLALQETTRLRQELAEQRNQLAQLTAEIDYLQRLLSQPRMPLPGFGLDDEVGHGMPQAPVNRAPQFLVLASEDETTASVGFTEDSAQVNPVNPGLQGTLLTDSNIVVESGGKLNQEMMFDDDTLVMGPLRALNQADREPPDDSGQVSDIVKYSWFRVYGGKGSKEPDAVKHLDTTSVKQPKKDSEWWLILLHVKDPDLVDKKGGAWRFHFSDGSTRVEGVRSQSTPLVTRGSALDRSNVATPTDAFYKFIRLNVPKAFLKAKIAEIIYVTIVGILQDKPELYPELITHLLVSQNRKWLVANTRLGGLNELVLTCQSADAVLKDLRLQDAYVGTIGTKKITFVELQRMTSMPTHYFVFKGTHEKVITGSGKKATLKCYDSHPTGRLYYVDFEGKVHKTVGPTSPAYHLDQQVRSLWTIFLQSGDVKTAVKRLYHLHKKYLATWQDIIPGWFDTDGRKNRKISAARAEDNSTDKCVQVYKLRGGGLLRLHKRIDLEWFAVIVHNHTCVVLDILKRLYWALEVQEEIESSSPPPSPFRDDDDEEPVVTQFSYEDRPMSPKRIPIYDDDDEKDGKRSPRRSDLL